MKKRSTALTTILITAAALTFSTCAKDSSNPYGSSNSNTNTPPNTVVMMNTAFSPTSLTVSKGTTITWKNNDGFDHTSTSDTGVWDTGTIPGGSGKTTAFPNAGTFKYHCAIHAGMNGTITVQ